MFAGWQDIAVAVVALGAAITVVWRTLGTWGDSKPGAGSPGCDHCPVGEEMKRPKAIAEAKGTRPKATGTEGMSQ